MTCQQSKIILQAGRVEGLTVADAAEGLLDSFLAVAVGPCRMTTRTIRRSGAPAWDEQFLLREDDLMVADMRILFEIWSVRKWSADSVVAQAELVLDEDRLADIDIGQHSVIRLPLYTPSKVTKSKASVKPPPPVGYLSVRVILQPGEVDSGLPADLMPSCSVDAAALPAASVLHTAVGSVYVEPCVVMLRLRLVAARGLQVKPRSNSAFTSGDLVAAGIAIECPPACIGPHAVSRATSARSNATEDTMNNATNESAPANTIAAVSDKLQKQGAEMLGVTMNFFSKMRAKGKAASERVRNDGKGDQLDLAGMAVMTATNLFGDKLSAAPPRSAEDAAQSAGVQAAAADLAAATDAAAASRTGSGNTAADSASSSPPLKQSAPAAPAHAQGQAAAALFPQAASTVAASSGAPPGGANSSSVVGPAADLAGGVQASKPSYDMDSVMKALDYNGFSAGSEITRGPVYFWCQFAYEAQSHTTRMVQPNEPTPTARLAGPPASGLRTTSATWGGAESWVIAAVRPISDRPLEMSLYASTDAKSRGKVVCSMSMPLNEVLATLREAAPADRATPVEPHSTEPDRAPALPPTNAAAMAAAAAAAANERRPKPQGAWYSPTHWARGVVIMQGKLEDGSPCEVQLEVEAVDEDARAAVASLPLLAPLTQQPHQASTGMVALTAAAAADAKEGKLDRAAAPSKPAGGAMPIAEANAAAHSPAGVALPVPTPVGLPPPRKPVIKALMARMLAPSGPPRSASIGMLQLILHEFEMEKPADYFVMFKCGHVWGCSGTVPSLGKPRWGWHIWLPLARHSELLSLAVFRRNDQKEGKKTLTMSSVMSGIVGNSEQLVGKLRIRVSTLLPGKLHDVVLPLWGERLQARTGGVMGKAHISLVAQFPDAAEHLASFFAPPLYPPLALLAMGAGAPPLDAEAAAAAAAAVSVHPTAPRDRPASLLPSLAEAASSSTDVAVADALRDTRGEEDAKEAAAAAAAAAKANEVLKHPPVSEEVLVRKRFKVILGWLEDNSPGVTKRVASRVLDDGRQEFTLSRARQNLMRIKTVVAAVQPLSNWYAGIQQWHSPPQTLAVAIAVVLLVAYPARAMALGALLVVLYLGMLRQMGLAGTLGVPPPMVDDIPAEAPTTPAEVTDSDDGTGAAAGPDGSHGPPGGPVHTSGHILVPLDPFTALKQQYDNLVLFMINIQNILDTIATGLERVQALFTWTDPIATAILCVGLLVAAAALWLAGPRSLVALALLWDLRPPALRDPMPAPPMCFLGHLPSRADRMM